MTEGDPVAQDIREIKWHQEAIDSSMELLVKAHKKDVEPEIMKVFSRARRRAEVYLKCDGRRTVTSIADELEMQLPNVSREITKLKSKGLIKIKDITDEGYIYEKTNIDKILGLSKKLKKKFNLEED